MKPLPKKSPAKRLFHGMAGSPLAVILKPAPVIETPRKRGPKPKFGVAMTPAERQTRSRANQKTKLDDAERRKLVAEILVIARRNLAGPDKPGHGRITIKRRQDIRDENRNFLRALHDNLLLQNVGELQKSLEGLSLPDSRGRLHNERSGETHRYGAKSEIEKILAGIQHDSSLFPETGDEDIDKQDPKMAGGFKVRPEGLGADEFEEDNDTDPADIRSGSAKPQYVPTPDEKVVRRTIDSIVAEISFETETACPFCSDLFLTRLGMKLHLETEYHEGERYVEKQRKFIDIVKGFNDKTGGALPVNPIDMMHKGYQHYRLVGQEIRTRKN